MTRALLFVLLALPAAGGELPYTDLPSETALRNLEKIGARDPAKLPEAEASEWVRSRFAWVALLRMQGREKEALEVFGGCKGYCAKLGSQAEWAALRRWACGKKTKAEPCR